MITAEELMTVSGPCYVCTHVTIQCAQCAVVIKIDVATGLPLDMARDADGKIVSVSPAGIPQERIAQRLVCDGCMAERNKLTPRNPMETASQRHARRMPPGAESHLPS